MLVLFSELSKHKTFILKKILTFWRAYGKNKNGTKINKIFISGKQIEKEDLSSQSANVKIHEINETLLCFLTEVIMSWWSNDITNPIMFCLILQFINYKEKSRKISVQTNYIYKSLKH